MGLSAEMDIFDCFVTLGWYVMSKCTCDLEWTYDPTFTYDLTYMYDPKIDSLIP